MVSELTIYISVIQTYTYSTVTIDIYADLKKLHFGFEVSKNCVPYLFPISVVSELTVL